jgi:hypothetical protein
MFLLRAFIIITTHISTFKLTKSSDLLGDGVGAVLLHIP